MGGLVVNRVVHLDRSAGKNVLDLGTGKGFVFDEGVCEHVEISPVGLEEVPRALVGLV